MGRQRAVFAVRPPWASALVTGHKRFEFRRVRPNIKTGDILYIYATSPIKAVVGTVVCAGVIEGHPAELWQSCGRAGHVPESRFFEYFDGSERGVAIEVTDASPWAAPLRLDAIRSHCPAFSPPQSYCFIADDSAVARLLPV